MRFTSRAGRCCVGQLCCPESVFTGPKPLPAAPGPNRGMAPLAQRLLTTTPWGDPGRSPNPPGREGSAQRSRCSWRRSLTSARRASVPGLEHVRVCGSPPGSVVPAVGSTCGNAQIGCEPRREGGLARTCIAGDQQPGRHAHAETVLGPAGRPTWARVTGTGMVPACRGRRLDAAG